MSKQYIVKQLNKLLKLDRNLIEKLVDVRYPVTEQYIKDPDFTCMENANGVCEAGLMGVINGLIPSDDLRIAASYDDTNNKLIGFVLIDRKTNKTI